MATKRAISYSIRHFDSVLSSSVRTASSHTLRRTATRTTTAADLLPFRTSQLLMPRMRQPRRHFTTTLVRQNTNEQPSKPSTLYTFEDIRTLSSKPSPNRILIDVREPSELQSTGSIPSAQNVPVSSSPDAFFLPAEEFEDKFGFPRPSDEVEVIFYCKAGVRSRAAAQLATQAGFGGKIGEFPGSWIEWEKNGGEVERK